MNIIYAAPVRTIAVFSLKGGVGKTTVAVNLAYALATAGGRRTLIWDLDAQGAASFILGGGAAQRPARRLFDADTDLAALAQPTLVANLSLLAADKSLRHLEAQLAAEAGPRALRKLLATLAPRYDRVVLDCPPGFSTLAEQLFRAADLIVEPLTPSPLAERAHAALGEHLAKHHRGGPRVLPVFSMVDRRRTTHRAALAAHPDRLALPYASVVERMAVERLPLGLLAPLGQPARAFTELCAATERLLIG